VQIRYIHITKARATGAEQLEALRTAGLVEPSQTAGSLYIDREPKRPKAGADPSPARSAAIKVLRGG
jgi:hypothetical protein